MTEQGSDWNQTAPTGDEIEGMARDIIAAMPEAFRDEAQGLAVCVADLIPEAMDDGESDPWAITGMYTGVSVMERQSGMVAMEPDAIWLFRLPILLEWAERGNVGLRDLVANVTVHEVAHHFGWSDADIAAIDRWWE